MRSDKRNNLFDIFSLSSDDFITKKSSCEKDRLQLWHPSFSTSESSKERKELRNPI
jgi:hypothetical protein